MKLMGRLLLMEAVLMLPSLLVSLIYGQGDSMAFVYAMLITATAGVGPAFFVKPAREDLNPKDGIAVAGLSWKKKRRHFIRNQISSGAGQPRTA